jgi:16S rRNA C967 or C1407 C5-methylase (RsmB/RsmF family)
VSCPKLLFDLLVKAYGEAKASEFCRVSNERAPVTIRVNTLKNIREELMQEWSAQKISFTPCEQSANGLVVQSNMNFFAMPEYKAGKFELQDEGSQLLADLVSTSPNDWVLDYCAGAGGKSLAIAAKMKNRGQLFLHDVRKSALLEARKRLNRAGVQNAQFVGADNKKKKKQLLGKMQWVLVDAPCSGTGTLRRNPDLKWRFTSEGLAELTALQVKIFSEAMAYVQPGSFIVYATCSVLPQENEEQASYFMKTYGLTKIKEFSSLPESGKMDGFYGVVFSTL